MRYSSFIVALSVSTMLCVPAFAQASKGLNKHDSSIANHDYNLPISTTTAPGGSLKDDLDRGVIDPSGNKTMPSASGMAGDSQPLQRPSPMQIQPIAVGSKAPNFNLSRAMGGYHTLGAMLEKGPAIVMFVRSASAPYSLQQLQLLQKNVNQFQQLGIQIVAITPDPLDALQGAQSRHNFIYDVLSDPGNNVARQFGIVQITESTPAMFSIDQQGNVVGIQLQPQMRSVFDLTEAALPLRPQLVATPQTMETPAPVQQQQGVIPAVPSPQAPPSAPQQQQQNIQDGAMAPRVNYHVPPSHPDFGKIVEAQMQTI